MYRVFVPVVIAALLAAQLSACGSTAGWRFEVGVAPVTAIHDTASLTEKGAK